MSLVVSLLTHSPAISDLFVVASTAVFQFNEDAFLLTTHVTLPRWIATLLVPRETFVVAYISVTVLALHRYHHAVAIDAFSYVRSRSTES